MRLLRNLGVVSGLTLASRVLGFLREILTAKYLGASVVADTFFQALTIPNTFRRIFAEGAFNSAFVPLYARELENADQAEADKFASEALSVLLTVTLSVVVIFQIAAPWLAYVFFPGSIGDPGAMAFGAMLLQITMPYLFTMAFTALIGGALNTHGRFAAAAGAPLLFNLVLIVILALDFSENSDLAVWLSIGVTASGVLQAVLLWMVAKTSGLKITLRVPRLTRRVKRLIALGVPGALAAGATQINVLVTSSIAMLETGARSYLNYAERLYQLPLGVIGIAMGVALLPNLTRRVRSGDEAGGQFAMNRAIELSLALTLPAAIAFLAAPDSLVEGLYQRGAFTAQSTANTALALCAYAVGLPAFVLVKVLAPGFFAREETRTPMMFALASVILNLVLALALFFGGLGFLGLALATSAAGWLNALLLAGTLSRRGLLILDDRFKHRLPRLALASLMMGASVYATASLLPLLSAPLAATIGADWVSVLGLAVLVTVGGGVYALACVTTGALRIGEVIEAIRPMKGAPPPAELE
ncbi:MAG: murein biosynthesis integral membrane protein MurJ [Oceanicaulis sp.]|jgi:putative peptidoglycan lipid II flippase|nr:murein biosynthesis integral membrane protein MurJ [Oceanicaulis sp.]